MWQILSVTILPIIAGYLLPKVDPIGNFLAPYLKYEWQSQVLLSSILLLCFLLPYRTQVSKKFNNYKNERRELFAAAIEIIKARTRITIDMINKFKTVFEENKYFIKPAQEKKLVSLITNIGDIRIDDEELKSNTLSPDERKNLVAHRRKLLDRVENMQVTIENYLRETT